MTSASLPGLPANHRTERAGVIAVASALNEIGLIWRETERTDVGIDGHIELVNENGHATGVLVAVQIKSGDSYFNEGDTEWRYYPEEKHRQYWERYPTPVLVVLHSPSRGESFWVDARLALKSPQRSQLRYIGVPKGNVLQAASAGWLFGSTGASTLAPAPVDDILKALASKETRNPHFPVSYLDLFLHGLSNLCRAVFCSIDHAREIAAVNVAEIDVERELSFGPAEQEFVFQYLLFLSEHNLAQIDVDQCLIDWHENSMQPIVFAPLTSRGRALVAHIRAHESARRHNAAEAELVVESTLNLVPPRSFEARVHRVRAFRDEILAPPAP